MREHQAAWTVRDALVDAAATDDVLLVVGAGAGDEAWLHVEHVLYGAGRLLREVAFGIAEQRIDAHQVVQLMVDALPFEKLHDLSTDVLKGFLVDEAPIEDGNAAIGDG